MSEALVTAATIEPISLAEAKLHLRVDHSADDALIALLITIARQYVESETNRSLLTTTWDLFLDDFPCDGGNRKASELTGLFGLEYPRYGVIELPRPPLQSITWVKYAYPGTGTMTALSASAYQYEAASDRGRLCPAYGYVWPTPHPVLNAVNVRFVAGCASSEAFEERFAPLKQAMLLLIGVYYEQREAVAVGKDIKNLPVPFAVEHLCGQYQSWRAA